MSDLMKNCQGQVEKLTALRQEILAAEEGLYEDHVKRQMIADIDAMLAECHEEILSLEMLDHGKGAGYHAMRLKKIRSDLMELGPHLLDEHDRKKLLTRVNGLLSDCKEEMMDFEMRKHEAFPQADQVLSQFQLKRPGK